MCRMLPGRKKEVFETMKLLKKSGKARFCGLAMWGAADTLHAFEKDTESVIEALECPFNILNKSNLGVVSIAKDRDIPVLTSQPLASGILTGKYGMDTKFAVGDNRAGFWTEERFQSVKADMEIVKSCVKPPVETMAQLALAYNLSYPGISCIIPGAKNRIRYRKMYLQRVFGCQKRSWKTWKHEGLCILTESSKSA